MNETVESYEQPTGPEQVAGEQLEVVHVVVEDDPEEIADVVEGSDDIESLEREADRLEELHDELRAKLVGNDQRPTSQ